MFSKKYFLLFQYVADNAKNDSKAPTFLNGLFRGYLAFDTGQPFHYRVRASLDCWCVSARASVINDHDVVIMTPLFV